MIIYKRKKYIAISVIILLLLGVSLLAISKSQEIVLETEPRKVDEDTEFTYYLEVSYKGVDKKGNSTETSTSAEVNSDYINVTDRLPDNLIFTGFEETIDGGVYAKYKETGNLCSGKVVDDTGEPYENETESTYHGLHYNKNNRMITFKVKDLQAGCVLNVGIKTRTPLLGDKNKLDFFNTAYAKEGKVSIKSNTVYTWMEKEGAADISTYKVTYILENLDTDLENLTRNLLPTEEMSYQEGVSVSLLADIEVDGYTFNGWTSDDVSINNGSFTMPSKDIIIKGSFQKKQKKNVTYIINGDAPSSYSLPDISSYYPNDVISLADGLNEGDILDGYRFLGWRVFDENDEKINMLNVYEKNDSEELILVESKTDFIMPNKDVKVIGTFEHITYKLEYVFDGDIKPDNWQALLPSTKYYASGTNVKLENPKETTGYEFTGWKYDSEFTMPEEDIVVAGEWKVINGTFTPSISKTIVNPNEYYKEGDIVEYKISITNNANYQIKNVLIEEKNKNTIISESEKYNLKSSHVIEVPILASNETIDIKVLYTVLESDYGVVENTAEIIGASADNNNYLDLTKEYKSQATFKVISTLNICQNVLNKNAITKDFQFHIENSDGDYDTWIKLSNNECKEIFVIPGSYKVTEVIPQEFILSNSTIDGNNYNNGELFEINKKEISLEFKNDYKKKGFFHSNEVIENTVNPKFLEVGDKYCFENECFYVIDNKGDNYKLLAEYNLYVGNIVNKEAGHTSTIAGTISTSDPLYGKQSSLAIGDKLLGQLEYTGKGYGLVAYNDINIIINNYIDYLNSEFNLDASVDSNEGLLTPSDLVDIFGCNPIRYKRGWSDPYTNWGCQYVEGETFHPYSTETEKNWKTESSAWKTSKYEWLLNTTFWIKATKDTYTPSNDYFVIVGGDGFFKPLTNLADQQKNNANRGVRPVIVVPKTSIKHKIPKIEPEITSDLEIGQEYCFGEECFNIIGTSGEGTDKTYTMLAKYNLFVGNKVVNNSAAALTEEDKYDSEGNYIYGKQNKLALGDKDENSGLSGNNRYGTVAYHITEINNYINDYVNYLNNTYSLNVIEGRLIEYDEVVNVLGCNPFRYINGSGTKSWGCEYNPNEKYTVHNSDGSGWRTSKYPWVTNTSYWIKNPGEGSGEYYMFVGGDGFFKPLTIMANGTNRLESNSNRGIRPVITVKASELPSEDDNNKPSNVPENWQDNGIFSDYYEKAYEKLNKMSLEEKVGQLLIMTYTNDIATQSAVKNYNLGGVIFFKKDFDGKTEASVKSMINNLQSKANETNSKIPLLMAVDEEGGKVTRIASNPNLITSEFTNHRNLFAQYPLSDGTYYGFKSSKDLYLSSGNNFDLIIEETKVKTNVLKRLGLNVNFAPVVDVSKSGSYMYERGRSLSDDPNIVAEYAKEVINTSHINDKKVSYTLKHFPGYGDAGDTHNAPSTNSITLEELKSKSLVPFKRGIEAGAEAVMVNHVKYENIDNGIPASLSKKVHDILFNDLGFTGIAITDDLGMQGAMDENRFKKAVAAGNHQLLVSEKYETAHTQILNAVQNEETVDGVVLNEEYLNKMVFKVLAWKYYKGLLT